MDRLSASVGGDPNVDFFAANLLINLKALPSEVVARARRYRDAEPDDVEADILLLAAYTFAGDYPNILDSLTEFHRRHGKAMSPDTLADSSEFAGFVSSQAFEDYLKWHEQLESH